MGTKIEGSRSASMIYAMDSAKQHGLAVRPFGFQDPVTQRLAGRVVIPGVLKTGNVDRESNTTRMGTVMLSRGVDVAATMALMEKVGHQNGLFSPANGMLGFEARGTSVSITPILGATQRGQAQALSEKNNYPVAWVQAGSTVRLASYNRDTEELEHEVIRTRDLSDHAPLSKDVHMLRGINALLIDRGVSTPARAKFLGFLEKHGVTHVITDKERGVFQVSLKSGVNVTGQILRGGRYEGQEVPVILTIDGERNVITA